MSAFLGIARERVFSPGKVDADRLILEAVAAVLRRRGHAVRVVSAEASLASPPRHTMVFTMAQGERSLATLREWETAGVRVINSVAAILNCHRHRMVEHFQRAQVAAPETILIETTAVPLRIRRSDPTVSAGEIAWPSWLDTDGGWLKRGDVHATEADDVVFLRSADAAAAALARFQARRIARAVLQRHADGVVVKFYAARNGFLAWYPAPETPLELTAEQVAALGRLAASGARALGLEVYGGDCVVSINNELQLIDLNDWPSYAPCRAEAAEAIAAHLEARSESSDQ